MAFITWPYASLLFLSVCVCVRSFMFYYCRHETLDWRKCVMVFSCSVARYLWRNCSFLSVCFAVTIYIHTLCVWSVVVGYFLFRRIELWPTNHLNWRTFHPFLSLCASMDMSFMCLYFFGLHKSVQFHRKCVYTCCFLLLSHGNWRWHFTHFIGPLHS